MTWPIWSLLLKLMKISYKGVLNIAWASHISFTYVLNKMYFSSSGPLNTCGWQMLGAWLRYQMVVISWEMIIDFLPAIIWQSGEQIESDKRWHSSTCQTQITRDSNYKHQAELFMRGNNWLMKYFSYIQWQTKDMWFSWITLYQS